MNPVDESVLEAIRVAHCDRKGQGHPCAGTCTIGPNGFDLSCPLCGKTDDMEFMFTTESARMVRAIFVAAGIDPSILSIERHAAAIKKYDEIKRRA